MGIAIWETSRFSIVTGESGSTDNSQ